MAKHRSRLKPTFAAVFSILLAVFLAGANVHSQELKAADVIKRHLDAIGTAETRAAMKNYFAVGTSSFASKMPDKKTAGKVLIVSQDRNLFVLASFASQEYPYEKIGYFNESASLPFVTAGTRSPLGAFIADHPAMLSNGLLAGSVSAGWGFLDEARMKGRVAAGGTKKVDGRKAYIIDYFPPTNSSEFSIKLYFDAETFHHLRTEYRHQIAAKPAKFGSASEQDWVKLSVTEKFSDHKPVEGMTLPHSYRISYQTDSNNGVYEYDWGFAINNYYFNQKLEPDFFTFEAKKAQ
jgi:hypothetical protein